MSGSEVILMCVQYEFIGEKVCTETRAHERERDGERKGVCVTL